MATIYADGINTQNNSNPKNVATLVDSEDPPRFVDLLSLAGGYSTAPAPYDKPLAYSYDPVSGTLTLSGAVRRGSSAGDGITVLPSQYSPEKTTGAIVAVSGSASVILIFGQNEAGTGQINAPGGSGEGDLIFFDGVVLYLGER